MEWLFNMFGTSDYLERDPEKKFYVGIGHLWVGGYLVTLGLPIAIIVAGYIAKEVIFDLRGKFKNKLLLADSVVDFVFVVLGVMSTTTGDWRYGAAGFVVALSYFAAVKVFK